MHLLQFFISAICKRKGYIVFTKFKSYISAIYFIDDI